MELSKYKRLIDSGHVPVWTGVIDEDDLANEIVSVKLAVGASRRMIRVWVPSTNEKDFRVLKKRTASKPGSVVSDFPGFGAQVLTRRAVLLLQASDILTFHLFVSHFC